MNALFRCSLNYKKPVFLPAYCLALKARRLNMRALTRMSQRKMISPLFSAPHAFCE